MTILTGTNGHTWREFADRLYADSSDSVSVVDALSESLTKRLQSTPATGGIIFAECPASLIASGVKAPGTLLDEWKTSAAALLALWRRNRKHITILNWDECLADPLAFDEWMTSRFGRKLVKGAHLLARAETSLAKRVIAYAIVDRDRDATRLRNELQAASQPLSKKAAVLAQTTPEFALAEITQQQKRLAAERDALTARLSSLESDHSLLSTLHSSLVAECDALATRLDSLQSEHFSLSTLHSSLIAERDGLVTSHDAVVTERDGLAAKLTETQHKAIETHEMLLQEIQNAHKESEDFFEQWKGLEASSGEIHLSVERVLRGGEKHHPPHNHLDYVFESASLFERHWRRLPVRLVEHNGNAGLALFHPLGTGTTPLYHWAPDGQENGLDFMLFVPNDKKVTAKLVGVPASDLLLVRDAAAKILGHLSVHEGPEAERWLFADGSRAAYRWA